MATGGRLLERALDAAGGEEAFDRGFRQYEASLSFIEEHRADLLKKYDKNWIAVYESKIVAHAGTLQELMRKISSTGLPTAEPIIEFISSRKVLTLYYT